MKSRISPHLKDLLGAIISAALLVLAFPNFDLGFLAWVALVPLLMALYGKSYLKSFALALLCGVIFWSGLVYWLMNVPMYTLLHYAILMPYLGCFFGLFGLLFCFTSKRRGIVAAYATAPFVWVALDYARTHFFWLALPWGMLAHSQYHYPAIIQVTSFTGAYGVSFMVMAVNAAVALAIQILVHRRVFGGGSGHQMPAGRTAIVMALITVVILAGSLLYGRAVLSRPIEGQAIKISLVQGNISQDQKWDRKYARFIMQTYTDLTMEASRQQPALIAWPETATPAAISLDRRVYTKVMKIAFETQIPLLLGSAERRKYEKEKLKARLYTNSAFLLNPAQAPDQNQRYDKVHLLPFGEYLPAKDAIPWRAVGVRAVQGYNPGKEFTVLDLPPYRFSVPICWENIFPYVARNFVKNGAQFIINITNAAYFGRTAAPYQVLSMNVFRAVENRRYVARAANIGISCIIDPYGRVVDRVKDEKGEEIFVRGVLTGTVIPQDAKTFYTRYGDVFAWLCVGVSVAVLIAALFRGPYRKNKPLEA